MLPMTHILEEEVGDCLMSPHAHVSQSLSLNLLGSLTEGHFHRPIGVFDGTSDCGTQDMVQGERHPI